MLGLSVIILFKSLLHVFCSLVFSAHNSSASGTKLYEQIHVLSHKHITPSITPPPMTTAVRGEHITLVSFGGGSERKIPRLARPPPAAKSALDMPQLCDSIGNLW